METTPEFWLRGPVAGISDLLQPVAHALLQSRMEITDALQHFPDALLWQQPAGIASVGFHLQHIAGVIDRMGTYAKGVPLNDQQFKYLSLEGKSQVNITVSQLLNQVSDAVEQLLLQLQQTEVQTLTQARGVGRQQLPSTVMGLLFHAAEHCARHTGQLLVTSKILVQLSERND